MDERQTRENISEALTSSAQSIRATPKRLPTLADIKEKLGGNTRLDPQFIARIEEKRRMTTPYMDQFIKKDLTYLYVQCETFREAVNFFKFLNQHNYTWRSTDSLRGDNTEWHTYGPKTIYCFKRGAHFISYGAISDRDIEGIESQYVIKLKDLLPKLTRDKIQNYIIDSN